MKGALHAMGAVFERISTNLSRVQRRGSQPSSFGLTYRSAFNAWKRPLMSAASMVSGIIVRTFSSEVKTSFACSSVNNPAKLQLDARPLLPQRGSLYRCVSKHSSIAHRHFSKRSELSWGSSPPFQISMLQIPVSDSQ